MLLRQSYHYVAEASDHEGRRLGAIPLAPDFSPAAEWTHLQGVRRGVLPAFAHHGPGAVEPVFDGALGAPFVVGIRIRFDAQDPAHEVPTIPRDYFEAGIQEQITQWVADGVLQAGAIMTYRICAFPLAADNGVEAGTPCAACEEVSVPLSLSPGPLAPRIRHTRRSGQSAWNDNDLPLFVRPGLLGEATAQACAAGERETGGILIGHLHRDTETPEIYLELTAQISASFADAGRTHLGLTPETWAAVNDTLALRGRDEIIAGWWHYHPFFCRHCESQRRRQCALSRPFFSREDCELHRAVFDTAFSVALLLSDIGEASLSSDWFGWRYGSIAARGCYLPIRD